MHALKHMSLKPVLRLGEQNGADFGRWDLRVALRRYPIDLLLLLADPAESVVPADDMWIIEETIGPKGRIEVFAGEGHTLHRTAFERYIQVVAGFLA